MVKLLYHTAQIQHGSLFTNTQIPILQILVIHCATVQKYRNSYIMSISREEKQGFSHILI